MQAHQNAIPLAPETQAAVRTFKDRDAWIRGVITDKQLSAIERLIGVRLAEFLHTTTGRCDPAYETLASEIGVHRVSAIRAVAALAERG